MPLEVIGRFVRRVTGQAVGQAQVIDTGRLPGISAVTRAALTGEVNRGLVGRVTRYAIRQTGVIHFGGLPGRGRHSALCG